VGAAAKHSDDAVRLDVMVAGRDVEADHLTDADISHRFRSHDHEVTCAKVRLHASGEHRLGPVETRVRNER
jgi:hypothetical protein